MDGPIYKLSEIPGLLDMIHDETKPTSQKYLIQTTRENRSQRLRVIRYDKEILPHSLVNLYGICRYIVVNDVNKVIGFAPPKSMLPDMFMQRYRELENIQMEEYFPLENGYSIFINGPCTILIDEKKEKEKEKEKETILQEYITHAHTVWENMEESERFIVSLNLSWGQDPTGLIVVAAYYIENREDGDVWVYTMNAKPFLTATVRSPKTYDCCTTYSQMIETFGSMNTHYSIPGVIARNVVTGERTKIVNPHYVFMKQIGGADPQLLYQYLCLRKERKIQEYLNSSYSVKGTRHRFSSFRDQLHVYTDTLYQNYVDCFIAKKGGITDFPEEYQYHMRQLQKKYLNALRPIRGVVNKRTVMQYINDLHPSQILFWLYYNMRKRRVNYLKQECQ